MCVPIMLRYGVWRAACFPQDPLSTHTSPSTSAMFGVEATEVSVVEDDLEL